VPEPTILVVEDEPLLLFFTIELVKEAGYQAISAENADEAILILESRADITVVITDIEMPGSMDGLKLAAAIRDRWPPVELIVISGRSQPASQDLPERGLFFSKPYDTGLLQEALHRFVKGAAPDRLK
jgi:CheY-like chemotaxis protein